MSTNASKKAVKVKRSINKITKNETTTSNITSTHATPTTAYSVTSDKMDFRFTTVSNVGKTVKSKVKLSCSRELHSFKYISDTTDDTIQTTTKNFVLEGPCACPGGCNSFGVVDYCLHNNPCLNNSTCLSTLELPGFKCHCKPGYSGEKCAIDTCKDKDPCMNGGICTPTINTEGYNCTCSEGYNGKNCELDACSQNPCSDKGECKVTESAPYFTCNCFL